MGFRPDSFMQAEAAMAQIIADATREVERFEQKVADITRVAGNLADMSQAEPTGWLGAVQYINQQASNNPLDPAWQDLKAKSDKVVADFQAAQARVDSAVTALSGI